MASREKSTVWAEWQACCNCQQTDIRTITHHGIGVAQSRNHYGKQY
jgi:hypothetical protein